MSSSELVDDNTEPAPAMVLSRMQAVLRQFQASGKAFQLVDASASAAAIAAPRKCRTLIILDSSFNPPTIAHMAMATSAVRDLQTQRRGEGGSGATRRHDDGGVGEDDDIRLLLLLAVNNADKAPKPASFAHRLLMMRAFATDIQKAWRRVREQEEESDEEELLVDVGLTTYPYFHDKSAAIAQAAEYDFLTSDTTTTTTTTITSSPSPQTLPAQQIFLAGYDTLIRIFNPKYYSPPVPEEGVLSKDKGDNKTPMQISLDPFLTRAKVRVTMRTDADWGGREEQMGYVEKIVHGDELEKIGGRREWAQRVEMVEAMEGKDGLVLSSTEAREAIKSKDWEKLRMLVPEGVASLIEQGEVVW